jgi:hypothetical protein
MLMHMMGSEHDEDVSRSRSYTRCASYSINVNAISTMSSLFNPPLQNAMLNARCLLQNHPYTQPSLKTPHMQTTRLELNATPMPIPMPMLRSRTLIRKRLFQPTPHLLTQITILIITIHIRLISFPRQLLQFLRQRVPLCASALDVDEHHDREGQADEDGEEPESL